MSLDKHPIATTARYLYLNSYAFLLIFLGGGAIVVPFFCPKWYTVAAALIVAFVCLRGGIRILRGWPDKKRKYTILVSRNANGLRPETFTEFMQAPCGRLLAHTVLTDLGIPEEYKTLKSLRPTFRQRLRSGCGIRPQRTVVHVFNDEKNEQS